MATQNFLTDATIVKIAPRVLSNNLVFAHYVSQDLRKGYADVVGAIVNFRMPMQGYAQENNLTITPTPINQTSIQFAVDTTETASWAYTVIDDSLSIQNFTELVIEPHLAAIAQKVDKKISLLTRTSPNKVGGTSSHPLVLTDLAAARQYMSEFDIPMARRFGALDPLAVSELTINSTSGSLVNLFEPNMVHEIVTEGSIGRTQGADYFESQQMGSFTAGTSVAANLSVATNSVDGDTFLALNDSASGTLNAGDILELTAIYAVNPSDPTNVLTRLRQFVVLATTVLSPAGAVHVPVACGQASAGIQATATPGALVTVSALPTTATTIAKVWGSSIESAVFQREAFGLVMIAPKAIPGLVECRVIDHKGMPMLYSVGADITQMKSYGRFDVLFGTHGLHPEYCIRLAHT